MPATTMTDILNPGAAALRDPKFPDAPEDWNPQSAEALAKELGITLRDEHWEVLRVLQGCYRDEKAPRLRTLNAALRARFRDKGGVKYLYDLFPAGPVVQGARLAGLHPPQGVAEGAEGSAQ